MVKDLNDMVGRTVLVGLTYVRPDGSIRLQSQFAGIVTSVKPLVAIERGDDELFTLPNEPEAFDWAAPGEYRLRGSGEVVVNPDFLTSWTIQETR
jgi:hypothetical protein